MIRRRLARLEAAAQRTPPHRQQTTTERIAAVQAEYERRTMAGLPDDLPPHVAAAIERAVDREMGASL